MAEATTAEERDTLLMLVVSSIWLVKIGLFREIMASSLAVELWSTFR